MSKRYGNDIEVILKRCRRNAKEMRKMCRNNAKRYRTNMEEIQRDVEMMRTRSRRGTIPRVAEKRYGKVQKMRN